MLDSSNFEISKFLLHGFDPQDSSVRSLAAGRQLGGDIQETIGSLLHIPDADIELRQQRFASLRLRRLIEGDSLKLLCSERTNEEVVLPRRELVSGIEDDA